MLRLKDDHKRAKTLAKELPPGITQPEQVTQQIIDALKNGNLPPWRQPWRNDPNCGSARSLSTLREYRGINVLLLGCAPYQSRWWGTFQAIKQARLAMNHYEQAVAEIPDRETDNKKLALYHAGRLALALRDKEAATNHLTALAQLDFSYRDVSDLLDKVEKLGEDSAESSPPVSEES